MYNPNVGRWLSRDPIGFEAGDANLYRYVRSQPTRYVDPSGLEIRVFRSTDNLHPTGLASGAFHHSIVVFDPVTKCGFQYDGQGPNSDGKHNISDLVLLFETRFFSWMAAKGSILPLKPFKGKLPDTLWGGTFPVTHEGIKINTNGLTYKQELHALDAVHDKLKQIKHYNALGPNSNTYAHQLLKLSRFRFALGA